MSECAKVGYECHDTQEMRFVGSVERRATSVRFDLVGCDGVWVKKAFQFPIELCLSPAGSTKPIYLEHGERCRQLGAALVLIQPEVVRLDPSRGWAAVGGRYESWVDVGREVSPQFELGADVSRDHATVSLNEDCIDIATYGRHGLAIEMTPDDLAADFTDRNAI